MAPQGSQHNRRSILQAAGALGVAFGFGSGIVSATPSRSPGPKENEILVGVAPSVSDMKATVRSALSGDAEIVHSNETIRYVAVQLPDGMSESETDRLIAALNSVEEIEYVEPNQTLEIVGFEPDDPMYDKQYTPEQINAPEAWKTTRGESNVLISVVDQGVDYTHENLPNVHDDLGTDFVGSGSDPMPENSSETHGTKVAGVAAGMTDDGTGNAGISDCTYLSARALGADGTGALSDIADAVQWSADKGADIINMSLATDTHVQTLQNACDYALNHGSLPIVAAGNTESAVRYPASYNSTVAVSAVNAGGELADFSCYGPKVDITAPGVNIITSSLNDEYAATSGTSLSCPVVSGVAGLALSVNPDLSAEELRNLLIQTAEDIGLPSEQQGRGRVDAAAVVQNALDEPDGRVIRFDGSFQSIDDYTPTNYRVKVSDELSPSMYKGASIDPELDMGDDHSVVEHVVKDHMDAFVFEGTILELEVDDGPADVYVDGQKIDPDTFEDDGYDDGSNDNNGGDDDNGNNDGGNDDGGDEPDDGNDPGDNPDNDSDGGDDGGDDDPGFDGDGLFGDGGLFDDLLDTDYWNNLFDQFGIDFQF